MPRLVEHLLGVEHLLLGRLEHRVHAPDDAHRQDHVRVLAALEEVAQDIVGDAPDEGDDLVVGCLVHERIHSTLIIQALRVIPAAQIQPRQPVTLSATRPCFSAD